MDNEKDKKRGLGEKALNFSNVIAVFFFMYLVVIIGQLMWRNFQINKNLEKMKNNVEIMTIQNEMLSDMLNYYRSDTYKELQIKQRLMMKRKGEKVILLPIRKDDKPFSDFGITTSMDAEEVNKVLKTNVEKWWDLFFEKK